MNIQGNPYELISLQKLQVRKEWHDIFKVLKGKKFQPIILYLKRFLFKIEEEIKNLSDEQKLRVPNTKPTLREMLKSLV